MAIPDFRNASPQSGSPEFAAGLAQIISNDLDLSGYFSPMDKGAFLEGGNTGEDSVNFKNWSVIGTELLVKASYACVGQSLELDLKLYDVYWGRQILGKRVLGETRNHRELMHRLSNDIIRLLTGSDGITMTRLAFVGTQPKTRRCTSATTTATMRISLLRIRALCSLPGGRRTERELSIIPIRTTKAPGFT